MNRKIFLLLFIIVFSFAYAKQPKWITKRPISSSYYVGIGVVTKNNNREYIQTAKNNALNDLSSEISVTISGEMMDIAIEKSGLSEEEIRTEIHSSTKAELEGYELVDTWESDNEYWVYYRLSKSLYASIIETKKQNAINLSLNYLIKAKENEKKFDEVGSTINSAIENYVQALQPIESYYGEPLEAVYQGENIYLQNEIISGLQWFLSKIKLQPINPKIDVKTGSSTNDNLNVRAILSDQGKEVNITNLPIQFSFIKGQGELVKSIRTNSNGIAQGQIITISPLQRIQMVKCSLDIEDYLTADSASNYLKRLLMNLNLPNSKFILNVSGPTVFIESLESNLGNALSVNILEPSIKKLLSDKGYTFTDDIAKADAMITIEASSREGSEMYGQYATFVDASISIVDMNTGEEIYKNSMQNIKGIQLSYDKAGLTAYRKISAELGQTIIPEIIEAMD